MIRPFFKKKVISRKKPSSELTQQLTPIKNAAGQFFIPKNRAKSTWLLDPNNWNEMQYRARQHPMRTEGPKGHEGSRRFLSFDVTASHPETLAEKELIFKAFRDEPHLSTNQELKSLLQIRHDARVVTETPIAIYKSPEGKWYTVILREKNVQTMKMLGVKSAPFLAQAVTQLGKLYRAGILHNDMGVQHFFIKGNKVILFDAELAESGDVVKSHRNKFYDLQRFIENAITEGILTDIKTTENLIHTFQTASGFENKHLIKQHIINHLEGVIKRGKTSMTRREQKLTMQQILKLQKIVNQLKSANVTFHG